MRGHHHESFLKMIIKKRKFKYLRDIFVRTRYEEILSQSIADIIKINSKKSKIKILDFGSGIEPSLIQMIRDKLSKGSIEIISHGYDLYDDSEINKLNKTSKNEFYFKSNELKNSDEYYDFAIVSDVLHHMNIENKNLIKETLKNLKLKSKYLIVKDHFQYGFFSNQIIRFMDFFGNLNSNIETPKKYFSKEQFHHLVESLNLSVKYKILDNRYHPKFLPFFNNLKYHFIYLLE